jgi:hypothetical protein
MESTWTLEPVRPTISADWRTELVAVRLVILALSASKLVTYSLLVTTLMEYSSRTVSLDTVRFSTTPVVDVKEPMTACEDAREVLEIFWIVAVDEERLLTLPETTERSWMDAPVAERDCTEAVVEYKLSITPVEAPRFTTEEVFEDRTSTCADVAVSPCTASEEIVEVVEIKLFTIPEFTERFEIAEVAETK